MYLLLLYEQPQVSLICLNFNNNTKIRNPYKGVFFMEKYMLKTEKFKYSNQKIIGWLFFGLVFIFSFVISQNNFSDAAIWIAACGLGFTLQKSRFCFASSFRDLFMFGSGHNMKAVLLAMSIASVGFVGILKWILPDPIPGEYLSHRPNVRHIL